MVANQALAGSYSHQWHNAHHARVCQSHVVSSRENQHHSPHELAREWGLTLRVNRIFDARLQDYSAH